MRAPHLRRRDLVIINDFGAVDLELVQVVCACGRPGSKAARVREAPAAAFSRTRRMWRDVGRGCCVAWGIGCHRMRGLGWRGARGEYLDARSRAGRAGLT
jgi:hypothetical protein